MNLTQPLHRALQQHPDRVMTIDGDTVRTTAEVADRVARLGGALAGLGVRPGDRVALLALNSDLYHEFFLGCWWIGAVAQPNNTRWSVDEIAYALNDAGSSVLVVDDGFAALVPQLRKKCPQLRHVIHRGAAEADALSYEELVAAADPVADVGAGGHDALALLLYTGGTTGRPKGVMVSHSGLYTSVLGTLVINQATTDGGVTLHTAPLFHIAAIAAWFSQNLIGGTHVFQRQFTPEDFLAAVQRHRVTNCALIPSMMQWICDFPGLGDYDVSSLRRITYGGSASSDGLRSRAVQAFPNAGFGQGYGMTETGVLTILGPDESPEQRATGRAIAHVDLQVHDDAGRPVPSGTVGEVVTRGDHVMVGYWGLPEVTAETLRGGWMHTGDLGYLDEDGYLYIVDRLKDIIITGGENVYSAEVENAIATHPAVSACAVIGRPDTRWGEAVHAVVVRRDGAEVSAEEIQQHVRAAIAGYKTPRSVEFADALPMTAAGKVLKKKLREALAAAPS